MKIELQKISIFPNVLIQKQNQLTLTEYFKGITEGKWQDVVLKCRAIEDNTKQQEYKKKSVPAVTASGLFNGRSDSSLVIHSGLIVIDIDDKDQYRNINDIKNELKEVPEIFAIHHSLRGKGLAVYFKINKAKHTESFEAITKMLSNDYGVVCDMSCSNVSRLRFVSYDPDCYLNLAAEVWKIFEKKNKNNNKNIYAHHIFSSNDVDYIINQIKERAVNIAPDYYSWLRIGFGLAAKFGEAGRIYFKIISSYYSGKQKINVDKQYDRCLSSEETKNGSASIKSFFYYAKLAGCNLVSERTSKIKTIAKIRRKQEETDSSGSIVNGKSDAKQYLEEFENISGNDVDDVLDQIWKIPLSELKEDESLLHDIEVFLKSNYNFRLNEITNIVEINNLPTNDYIFNSIYLKAFRIVSNKVTKEKVYDLIHSDFTPRYNPILEWFDKNKGLKTEGNIKKLSECIDSNLSYKDSDFVYYFLEKWLLSLIASAHGTYSILCLVFTGQEQGTGKTNFFRDLLPEPLRWLFVQNKLDGKEADVAKLMCSKWIIMDDEFGGKSKQDEKKFKELISTDKFSVRMPYQRYFEDMQRLAVLCGTSNDEHVINDLTGNRRIIPIQVNNIDEKKYNEIDKTALLIEIYWKYRKNQKGWFLSKNDIERLNEVCFDSRQVAPEMELPLKYFRKADINEFRAKFLSSSEIRSIIEKKTGVRLSQQKLSISLKNIGYVVDRQRIDGCQIRGFWLKEVSDFFDTDTENKDIDEIKSKKIADDLPF